MLAFCCVIGNGRRFFWTYRCAFYQSPSFAEMSSMRYEWPTVHVSEDVAEAAIKPIQRMLAISAKLGL